MTSMEVSLGMFKSFPGKSYGISDLEHYKIWRGSSMPAFRILLILYYYIHCYNHLKLPQTLTFLLKLTIYTLTFQLKAKYDFLGG